MKEVVIVGSGNLAEALALAISACKTLSLKQIYARNGARAHAIAALTNSNWTDRIALLAQAEIYLIAVSDGAVAEVAASLPIKASALVAHTAGSVALDALQVFPRRAVFYPLQTFTKGRRVDFSQIPIFIETPSEQLREEVEAFALQLSPHVFYADSTRRAWVHLAGVLACNFTNQMYALGAQTMQQAALPFELLKPLIAETAAKALLSQSPQQVQTGPAVRGDLATQQRHYAMLAEDPLLQNLYTTISQNIWETSKKK